MKKLIIAIDCDDVLLPTAEVLIDWYNNEYGTSLSLDDFYNRDPRPWGVDDYLKVLDRTLGYMRTDAYASVLPFPEAIDAVRTLARNHELHLVTGRSLALDPYTRKFLDVHFEGCFATVEHTGLFDIYDDPSKKRTKGQVCSRIKADILIDDHLLHGRNVLNHGVREVLLFGEYPWNYLEGGEPGITRCRDWHDVLQNIETISNE